MGKGAVISGFLQSPPITTHQDSIFFVGKKKQFLNFLVLLQEMRKVDQHDQVSIFTRNHDLEVQDKIRAYLSHNASLSSRRKDPFTFYLLWRLFGDVLRQINRRLPPQKKKQDTIGCGHVEPDGIKPHEISINIDNNTPENTSQTKESEWGHVIYRYCCLRHRLHCKSRPSVCRPMYCICTYQ